MKPRFFGPRHAVEASLVVAAPLVALGAGLSAWPIVGVSAGAYALVVAVELRFARRRAPAPAAEPTTEQSEVAQPQAETVRVLRRTLEPKRAVPRREPSKVVPIEAAGRPRRWNIWDLEQLAKEHTGGDSTAREERFFLLVHLREFADADGVLPVAFDPLVRDSFGELLNTP